MILIDYKEFTTMAELMSALDKLNDHWHEDTELRIDAFSDSEEIPCLKAWKYEDDESGLLEFTIGSRDPDDTLKVRGGIWNKVSETPLAREDDLEEDDDPFEPEEDDNLFYPHEDADDIE